MSITTTGYSLKSYVDIISEVRQALITKTGNADIDLSDDSLLGQLNAIWALKYAEMYELAAAQWSAGDPDTATGVALDRIVKYARMSRLEAIKAYGSLHFTDTVGKTITAGTQVRDLAGNTVETLADIVLNTTGVNGVVLNVTAVNNFTYTVTIGGVTYSYVSDATATVIEIISGLITSLSANSSLICSNVSNRLSIQSEAPFSVLFGTNLAVHNVTKAVNGQALIASNEVYEAGTLVYPVTNIGLTTVTNRQNWVTGRQEETDAELRARFKKSPKSGNATVDAIFARLSETEGVVTADVEDNWTLVTNANGLPAKSFECTVKGGSDIAVANTIWKAKPAGIQSFGNLSVNITDAQGKQQTVYFSRPTDQYIHVKVDYLLYNEEVFPSNGIDMIKQAILNYGESLGVGNDIIPQRIMAAIYNSVAGINNLTVLVGKTSTSTGTPTFSTAIVPIGRKEESVFDLSRIEVLPA